MTSAIAKACATYGLDEVQLREAGNYPRKARMYAIHLHRTWTAEVDDTYNMKDLFNDANFFGLNPEDSSWDSFRQRVYAFDEENLGVLPINITAHKMQQHLQVMADKCRVDIREVFTSRKHLFTQYRKRVIENATNDTSKETVKYSLKALERRIG